MLKKIILLFLFTWLIVDSSTGQNILPYQIHQEQLSNGLNVVTIPYDSPGLASFYVVVRVGSRDEVEAGKTGFAHFFEHMMFRGTEKYSKEAYSEKLKATGASANANTSLDRTLYHMTGSAKHLETMFDLESDRFRNLSYSVQDFKTEAGAVKGEYTKNNSSPYGRLNEALSAKAFDKHTYKHTTMGFFDDIVAMPDQYEFSLAFFERYYRPEYCTIIVVGDVKPEQVVALSKKYFGDWKRGEYTTKIPKEPVQTATKYVNVQVPQFPPMLDLNYKSPAFSLENNDFQALTILGELLTSETSDLYKKLVTDEQKVRNLSGGIYPTRDPYLFSITASLTDNKDMAYVNKTISDEIAKYKNELPSAKIIKETKERIRYSFALSMDSPDAVAQAVALYTWVSGEPEALNKSYFLFESVTPADIQRVAKKYLVATGLTVATISPDEKPILK